MELESATSFKRKCYFCSPTPELQWTKLSGGWPNGRTVFKNNDHTVIIQDATMQDTGKYA